MPPNEQLAALANATGGRAPGILMPGDKTVRDQNGLITAFGPFNVQTNMEDILEGVGVIVGLYGAGGNGKTSLICSICDPKLNPQGYHCPMVVLDAEAGIKSVAHLVGDNLHRVRIRTFTDLEVFVNNWEATPKSAFPWRSVYVDNLSDFVQKALQEQGFHNRINNAGATSSEPDFNAMTTRVTVILQKMRDLAVDYGVNLFFSLWEFTEKSEQGQILGYRADLTPKLSIRVKGILDFIGYLSIVENPPYWDRKLTFAPADIDKRKLDSKVRVRRDEAASKIPLELYFKDGPNFVDILNTLKRGDVFPVEKYRRRT